MCLSRNDLAEVLLADGFDIKIGDLPVGSRFFIVGLVYSRTDNMNGNFLVKGKPGKFIQELPSIHYRHIEVQQDQVGEQSRCFYIFKEIPDRILTIAKDMQLAGQPEVPELFGEYISINLVIVNDKDRVYLLHVK